MTSGVMLDHFIATNAILHIR